MFWGRIRVLEARQVNKEPILAKNIWLNTYEVECRACHEVKYPTLAERPKTYLCVLCRALDPQKLAQRRQAARQGVVTRRKKHGL